MWWNYDRQGKNVTENSKDKKMKEWAVEGRKNNGEDTSQLGRNVNYVRNYVRPFCLPHSHKSISSKQ